MGFILGEHQPSVNRHIEDAFAFCKQGRFNAKGLFQFGSQTDRLRFVVSLRAIVNLDLHGCASW